jgi:macrodomain Ter protein organizer (MatP/YcbG family)
MEIGEVSQERLREFIIKAIENGSYRNSEFIIEYIEKIEKRDDIEKLLKDRNPDFYYQLLEKENRVDEMFKLLRELKHHKEEFFKKHKKAYPKEAIDFFNAEIEKNLKSTGDEYYHKIADYLTHLKELIDKDEFSLKVQRLKDKYKRRRNFVKILNKRFG